MASLLLWAIAILLLIANARIAESERINAYLEDQAALADASETYLPRMVRRALRGDHAATTATSPRRSSPGKSGEFTA